jgi:Tol biopolymer transport system component
VIFSVISGKDRNSFHGRLEMVHADGSGGVDYVSDGQSLDLTPSFSPGGDQIAFASDRFGKRLSICMMATNGAPGVKKITSGENNDLWPSIDSQPSPHLYYQSLLDTRSEPRLFEVQIGAMSMDDFTSAGGLQPRISPGNDAVLYCALNEKSGKREIFRLSLTDKTGIPDNLANAPEDDDYDAAWSKDGSKIAYVVQRNIDDKENPTASNPSIWIQDLRNPGKPVQLTNNGSCDDRPVWDPSGNFIYFRSNRGGAWGIWKIPVH